MTVSESPDSLTDLQNRWKKRRREWAEILRPRARPIEDPILTLGRAKRETLIFLVIQAVILCGAQIAYSLTIPFERRTVFLGLCIIAPSLSHTFFFLRSMKKIRVQEQDYSRELDAYERELAFLSATKSDRPAPAEPPSVSL